MKKRSNESYIKEAFELLHASSKIREQENKMLGKVWRILDKVVERIQKGEKDK